MNVHHTTIYVSDIAKSAALYDALFAAIHLSKTVDATYEGMRCIGYGNEDHNLYWIVAADKENAPTTGFHIAFEVMSTELVDHFHASGVANGGQDNGGPGLRPHYAENYYGAFIKDPDGNNIEAVCFV